MYFFFSVTVHRVLKDLSSDAGVFSVHITDSQSSSMWCLSAPILSNWLFKGTALKGNSYEIIGLRRHGNKGCCSTTEK